MHAINKVALESIFRHNPTASLYVYTREGMDRKETMVIARVVNRLKHDGYKITLVSYNFTQMLQRVSSQAEGLEMPLVDAFLSKLPTYSKMELWAYNHESDFTRLLILLEHGGFYLDTDIVLTRSLSDNRFTNTITFEDSSGRINNNVQVFEPGHQFLVSVLRQMLTTYSPKVYDVGPLTITKVYNRQYKDKISVLPVETFQPVDWRAGQKIIFTQPAHSQENMAYQLLMARSSYGVHFNNRLTRRFQLRRGTLAHQILLANCLYCDMISNLTSHTPVTLQGPE